MPNTSWSTADTPDGPDWATSLSADSYISHLSIFQRGLVGRRRKAAMMLTAIWGGTIALHLFSWGTWLVWGLATLLGLHLLRLWISSPRTLPAPLQEQDPEKLPFVSLMVAAKNEEAVIANLVQTLCEIDYPSSCYELWVVDDNSSDRTPQVLDQLRQQYPQLKVLRRGVNATGGKSGALNQVVELAKGEFLAVFDADARVPKDLLRRVLPLFDEAQVGAVQVRKAIAQAEGKRRVPNFWLRGQVAEMALDSYYQQQRIAIGGLGELRGNGQFVRREALQQCGGWNEETITDDLDLTLRLHLAHWDIEFLLDPPVVEEGVTNAVGLWHQRNRWAEGGYQRSLDYWRLLARNRMGMGKTFDFISSLVLQYIVPQAAVPDLVMAIARNRLPLLSPLTTLTVCMSMMGMYMGLRRIQKYQATRALSADTTEARWRTLLQAMQGSLYMLHWFPIIATMGMRVAVRPKQLKWVKTAHHGGEDVWLDLPNQAE